MFRRIYIQIIFWLVIAGINIGFTVYFLPLKTVLLSTAFVLFFQALVFYINTTLLFPRFFSLNHVWRFLLGSTIFILIITLCQTSLDYFYFSRIIFKGVNYKPHLMMIFFRVFFWLVFIDMISTIYMLQDRIRKQAEQTQKIIAEKLNTELKLLKAQINPHFLFNTLNNIYSLTYMQSEKAPESVLKLSQMLRYVIEECSNEKVVLKSEIEYIENYIAFQQLKSPDIQKVTFDYSKANEDVSISPMLFMPFIENSFKYSGIDNQPDARIMIELTNNANELVFKISNTMDNPEQDNHGIGTGIENVKKRLEILYPNKHVLKIAQKNQKFQVELRLETI